MQPAFAWDVGNAFFNRLSFYIFLKEASMAAHKKHNDTVLNSQGSSFEEIVKPLFPCGHIANSSQQDVILAVNCLRVCQESSD